MAVPKGTRIGGRPKGGLNKATADVKAVASQYTDEAIAALAEIMRKGESEAARVSAIKELLDRGHGKATQGMTIDANLQGNIDGEINVKLVRPGGR